MLLPNPNPHPTGRLVAAFGLGWVLFLVVGEMVLLPALSLWDAYYVEGTALGVLGAAGLSWLSLRRALMPGQVRLRTRDAAAILRWADVYADEASGFWEATEREPGFVRYDFTLRVLLVGFEESLEVRARPDGAVVIDGPRGQVAALARHLIDAGAAVSEPD